MLIDKMPNKQNVDRQNACDLMHAKHWRDFCEPDSDANQFRLGSSILKHAMTRGVAPVGVWDAKPPSKICLVSILSIDILSVRHYFCRLFLCQYFLGRHYVSSKQRHNRLSKNNQTQFYIDIFQKLLKSWLKKLISFYVNGENFKKL